MDRRPTIGRAEADVLRYVADHSGVTVTEVGEHLASTKGQTRNTALNMMERLRAKGFLKRSQIDGIYRYFPSSSKRNLLEGLVEEFVDSVLGGSVSPLVAYLTGNAEIDEAQLKELRRLLDTLESSRADAGEGEKK